MDNNYSCIPKKEIGEFIDLWTVYNVEPMHGYTSPKVKLILDRPMLITPMENSKYSINYKEFTSDTTTIHNGDILMVDVDSPDSYTTDMENPLQTVGGVNIDGRDCPFTLIAKLNPTVFGIFLQDGSKLKI